MSGRPPAVAIYCVFALVLVLWCAVSTFGLMTVGDIAPIPYALTFLAFIAAIIGFWFMRWWSLVVGVPAAGYVAFVSFFHVLALAQVAMAAFAVPMLIIAFMYRDRFRW